MYLAAWALRAVALRALPIFDRVMRSQTARNATTERRAAASFVAGKNDSHAYIKALSHQNPMMESPVFRTEDEKPQVPQEEHEPEGAEELRHHGPLRRYFTNPE